MINKLDDRKRDILSAVIENFIYSAEPAGSKKLVENYGWPISAATVRNELAVLEELGYLSHPHTSAGRVPTDKGYRFYVDRLAKREPGVATGLVEIGELYTQLTREIGELMRRTSQLLSGATSTMAIVYAPDIRREKIKHVDLIGLGSGSLMIVVIMSNGSISKQVVALTHNIRTDRLAGLQQRLNDALSGASLDGDWDVSGELDGLSVSEYELLNQIATSVLSSLEIDTSDRVYYDGAAHLLDYPELTDMAEMRRVMTLIEHNYALLEWLREASKSGELAVSIGAENQLELTGYTVIASGYEVRGESAGFLGVLGPTRMDYRRTISAVKQTADQLGKALDELEG